MDIRIGIAQSGQVIELELGDDTDRDKLKKQVDETVGTENGVLWLTDRKGKEVAIAADRVAFVELSSSDPDRRIGFGA
ncbi:MAG: DUF3107 domain-containing protein [Actinomycetota bacterium]